MKLGIHKDIDIEKYHEDRTILSSTGLKKAKNSTRDFIYYVLHGSKGGSHFDFGNAFEIAVMDAVNGTNFFDKEVAVLASEEWERKALELNPDLVSPKASKGYKELKAKFEAENDSKYLINDVGDTESDWALQQMVKSCTNNEVISQLLKGTEYQVSLVWEDLETGLKLKTRPDVCKAKKNVVVDIKTCKDASPHGFARDAANLDYPLQACMQIDGAIQTGLMDTVDSYFWLAVEKTPPYNVALYEFQQEDIKFFMDTYRFYLDRCAKGLKELSELKDYDLSGLSSYGEQADNKFGILQLEIPLWYRGI